MKKISTEITEAYSSISAADKIIKYAKEKDVDLTVHLGQVRNEIGFTGKRCMNVLTFGKSI
jgi:hypothetical protein